MVYLMCSFDFRVLCSALHLFFPFEFMFGTFGSLAGIAPCSFALPRLGFVINLFFIVLSGRLALGNIMLVGGLKPHVLEELDLGICFNLSISDILKWKATEISSCSLSLEVFVISQHLFLQTLRHAF